MKTETQGPDAPTSWAALVDRIVSEVRSSFGAPVAERVGLMLTLHRDAGEVALDPSLAEAHRRAAELRAAAEADRDEAEKLVSDAVNSWRAARGEIEAFRRRMYEDIEQEREELRLAATESRDDAMRKAVKLQAEIADMVARLDDLRAPLDAREAELIAWEAELHRQAGLLGIERTTPPESAATAADPPATPPDATTGTPSDAIAKNDDDNHDNNDGDDDDDGGDGDGDGDGGNDTSAIAASTEAGARVRSKWGAGTGRTGTTASRQGWRRTPVEDGDDVASR